MLLPFLKWIQSGKTTEFAEAVEANPSLAEWHDAQGISALMWSIYYQQPLVRDFLLAKLAERGVKLDIFEAAATGNTVRLEEILASDPAAVQAYSPDGWTALHLAAAFGTPQAALVLLQHGANVSAVSKNPQRNQALHAALSLGCNIELTTILLNHGADPNAVQVGGFTPLFSAASSNRKDLAELLVLRGANPNPANDAGKTPADFARERGHLDMAEWIESLPAGPAFHAFRGSN